MVKEPVCIRCGKHATIFDVNPYLEEFANDEEQEQLEREWWCTECYLNEIKDA